MIILYTTPTCAPCAKIKEWLKARDIPFEMGDIGEMFLKTGAMSVPTLVWGDVIINGYRPQLMEKLYEIGNTQK